MTGVDRGLVAQIRADLVAAADPERAPAQQKYMKSALPFFGVRVPEVRAIVRRRMAARSAPTAAEVAATAAVLWREATHREHRYAATSLTDTGPARRVRDLSLLPLFEEFIRTGAWWDHVDETAERIGWLLQRERPTMTPLLRQWATDPDRWIRRVSVIAQLRHREATDVDLLTHAIDANAADPDFFLRKAIGWALRDYAATNPDWVRRFLADRQGQLSALSVREASKHL